MQNRVMNFLSNISLEIYLCHMIFFRIVEKLNLNNYIDNANVCYLVVCVIGIGAAVIFSYFAKKIYRYNNFCCSKRYAQNKNMMPCFGKSGLLLIAPCVLQISRFTLFLLRFLLFLVLVYLTIISI